MKPQREKSEKIYIYGKHALMEALAHAPRAVRKIFLSPEANGDAELRELVSKRNVPVEVMKSREADRMVGEDASHQGVIAIADPSAIMVDFHDFARDLKPTRPHLENSSRRSSGSFSAAKAGFPSRDTNRYPLSEDPASRSKNPPDDRRPIFEMGSQTMLVLLDELTDPHNVGAIIRSAAAFGSAGVLLPSHNQAPITGAVVKASAGMVFRMPIVSLGNVNQAVDFLKKEFDFRIYGLAMDGPKNVAEENFDAPALIIIGNEGKGIRQKTLERCDVKLRIPMDPRCESLNASVSAAITLYQWSLKHLNSSF
jgi:predicted rRNA methylase